MKYVFLTYTVENMGGSIIYTNNKVRFLEEIGWAVRVFSHEKGNIVLEGLRRFNDNILLELKYHPSFYTKADREFLLQRLQGAIEKQDRESRLVIESQTLNLSLWGEMLAEKLKAKHIVYLLHETFPPLTHEMYSFLDFKHKRRELAGITGRSLEILFKNYKELKPDESYYLKAACTNVVEDVENSIIDSIRRSDIMIGSIGRLEKGYVRALTKNSIAFANSNPTRRVSLVLVGGTRDEKVARELRKITSPCSNLDLIITGFMYPIPRKLFSLVDIFVSGAGSARVSAAEGVLTMTVDVNTGKPIGLLGYDTNNSIYGDKEQTKSIAEMLQEVLLEKEMHKKKIPMKYEQTIPDFRQRYAEHMDFIERSEQEKEYYPIDKIKLVDKRGSIKKLLFKTLGRNGYEKVVSMYARLKAKKRY